MDEINSVELNLINKLSRDPIKEIKTTYTPKVEKKSKVNNGIFSFVFPETFSNSNIGWVLSNIIDGALSNTILRRISFLSHNNCKISEDELLNSSF